MLIANILTNWDNFVGFCWQNVLTVTAFELYFFSIFIFSFLYCVYIIYFSGKFWYSFISSFGRYARKVTVTIHFLCYMDRQWVRWGPPPDTSPPTWEEEDEEQG